MGKGTIVANLGSGQYTVTLNRDVTRITARIAKIDARISALATVIVNHTVAMIAAEATYNTELAAMNQIIVEMKAHPEQVESLRTQLVAQTKKALQAQKTWQAWQVAVNQAGIEQTALTKEKAVLEGADLQDPTVTAWCADLSEELSGVVGTIEVPGERGTVNIKPGYNGAEAYSAATDGELQPTMAGTPSSVYYNWAMFPGWQKWKPTYRYGTIVEIDKDLDTCSVNLDPAQSSAQGLNINQAGTPYTAPAELTVNGWTDFAASNPTWPLVTNTSDSKLPMTPALAADLTSVNKLVNGANTYRKDAGDTWQIMPDGGSYGDCEDFALTKAQKLIDLGYPASAIHIEVGNLLNGEGHAWLIVATSDGDMALDINYPQVILSNRMNYTNRQRQTGMQWNIIGDQLVDVPIEYMNCNSVAFEVDDKVIVKFEDQDWTKPKVIGFKDNPDSCNRDDIFMYGYSIELYRDNEHIMLAELEVWDGPYPLHSIFKITDSYIVVKVSPIVWEEGEYGPTGHYDHSQGTFEIYDRVTFAHIQSIPNTALMCDIHLPNSTSHTFYRFVAHSLLIDDVDTGILATDIAITNGKLYAFVSGYNSFTERVTTVIEMSLAGQVIQTYAIDTQAQFMDSVVR